MMRRPIALVAVSFCVLFVGVATSRSDAPSPTGPAPAGMPSSEPATEPLGPNPPRDPLTTYDVGPASAVWQYDDLAPAEQAIVDKAANDTEWQTVNAVYTAAAAEQFERARTAMAEHRLGLADLEVGVVP